MTRLTRPIHTNLLVAFLCVLLVVGALLLVLALPHVLTWLAWLGLALGAAWLVVVAFIIAVIAGGLRRPTP
jgi:membrane protease YdiL (CAAX protease family)